MTNDPLNRAVEELFTSRRLLRRFRRDPERALSRFELSHREVEAVKRGDVEELLGLGLNPALVWPQPASRLPVQSWLLRSAKRLVPAAVIAGALLAWPSSAHALPRDLPRGGRVRALRALTRAFRRAQAPRGVERAIVRNVERAIRPPGGGETP